MPATIYGIEKFLGSSLIKGIGQKFVKRIGQQFGTDTIAVIEDVIDHLFEVEGIRKKRVQMVREN